MAGLSRLRIPLEKWVAAGAPADNLPATLADPNGSFTALLVDRDGKLFEFDNGYLVPIEAEYAAIGSGGHLAMGAMAHGATAEEAVKAAAKHDKNTGGAITVIHFSTLTQVPDDRT